MAFQESSNNIRIEGSFLKADCANLDGDFVPSEIDLNNYLGNSDGKLVWGESGFLESSEDLQIPDGRVLIVQVRDMNGDLQHNEFDLGRVITNNDGRLEALDPSQADN